MPGGSGAMFQLAARGKEDLQKHAEMQNYNVETDKQQDRR